MDLLLRLLLYGGRYLTKLSTESVNVGGRLRGNIERFPIVGGQENIMDLCSQNVNEMSGFCSGRKNGTEAVGRLASKNVVDEQYRSMERRIKFDSICTPAGRGRRIHSRPKRRRAKSSIAPKKTGLELQRTEVEFAQKKELLRKFSQITLGKNQARTDAMQRRKTLPLIADATSREAAYRLQAKNALEFRKFEERLEEKMYVEKLKAVDFERLGEADVDEEVVLERLRSIGEWRSRVCEKNLQAFAGLEESLGRLDDAFRLLKNQEAFEQLEARLVEGRLRQTEDDPAFKAFLSRVEDLRVRKRRTQRFMEKVSREFRRDVGLPESFTGLKKLEVKELFKRTLLTTEMKIYVPRTFGLEKSAVLTRPSQDCGDAELWKRINWTVVEEPLMRSSRRAYRLFERSLGDRRVQKKMSKIKEELPILPDLVPPPKKPRFHIPVIDDLLPDETLRSLSLRKPFRCHNGGRRMLASPTKNRTRPFSTNQPNFQKNLREMVQRKIAGNIFFAESKRRVSGLMPNCLDKFKEVVTRYRFGSTTKQRHLVLTDDERCELPVWDKPEFPVEDCFREGQKNMYQSVLDSILQQKEAKEAVAEEDWKDVVLPPGDEELYIGESKSLQVVKPELIPCEAEIDWEIVPEKLPVAKHGTFRKLKRPETADSLPKSEQKEKNSERNDSWECVMSSSHHFMAKPETKLSNLALKQFLRGGSKAETKTPEVVKPKSQHKFVQGAKLKGLDKAKETYWDATASSKNGNHRNLNSINASEDLGHYKKVVPKEHKSCHTKKAQESHRLKERRKEEKLPQKELQGTNIAMLEVQYKPNKSSVVREKATFNVDHNVRKSKNATTHGKGTTFDVQHSAVKSAPKVATLDVRQNYRKAKSAAIYGKRATLDVCQSEYRSAPREATALNVDRSVLKSASRDSAGLDAHQYVHKSAPREAAGLDVHQSELRSAAREAAYLDVQSSRTSKTARTHCKRTSLDVHQSPVKSAAIDATDLDIHQSVHHSVHRSAPREATVLDVHQSVHKSAPREAAALDVHQSVLKSAPRGAAGLDVHQSELRSAPREATSLDVHQSSRKSKTVSTHGKEAALDSVKSVPIEAADLDVHQYAQKFINFGNSEKGQTLNVHQSSVRPARRETEVMDVRQSAAKSISTEEATFDGPREVLGGEDCSILGFCCEEDWTTELGSRSQLVEEQMVFSGDAPEVRTLEEFILEMGAVRGKTGTVEEQDNVETIQGNENKAFLTQDAPESGTSEAMKSLKFDNKDLKKIAEQIIAPAKSNLNEDQGEQLKAKPNEEIKKYVVETNDRDVAEMSPLSNLKRRTTKKVAVEENATAKLAEEIIVPRQDKNLLESRVGDEVTSNLIDDLIKADVQEITRTSQDLKVANPKELLKNDVPDLIKTPKSVQKEILSKDGGLVAPQLSVYDVVEEERIKMKISKIRKNAFVAKKPDVDRTMFGKFVKKVAEPRRDDKLHHGAEELQTGKVEEVELRAKNEEVGLDTSSPASYRLRRIVANEDRRKESDRKSVSSLQKTDGFKGIGIRKECYSGDTFKDDGKVEAKQVPLYRFKGVGLKMDTVNVEERPEMGMKQVPVCVYEGVGVKKDVEHGRTRKDETKIDDKMVEVRLDPLYGLNELKKDTVNKEETKGKEKLNDPIYGFKAAEVKNTVDKGESKGEDRLKDPLYGFKVAEVKKDALNKGETKGEEKLNDPLYGFKTAEVKKDTVNKGESRGEERLKDPLYGFKVAEMKKDAVNNGETKGEERLIELKIRPVKQVPAPIEVKNDHIHKYKVDEAKKEEKSEETKIEDKKLDARLGFLCEFKGTAKDVVNGEERLRELKIKRMQIQQVPMSVDEGVEVKKDEKYRRTRNEEKLVNAKIEDTKVEIRQRLRGVGMNNEYSKEDVRNERKPEEAKIKVKKVESRQRFGGVALKRDVVNENETRKDEKLEEAKIEDNKMEVKEFGAKKDMVTKCTRNKEKLEGAKIEDNKIKIRQMVQGVGVKTDMVIKRTSNEEKLEGRKIEENKTGVRQMLRGARVKNDTIIEASRNEERVEKTNYEKVDVGQVSLLGSRGARLTRNYAREATENEESKVASNYKVGTKESPDNISKLVAKVEGEIAAKPNMQKEEANRAPAYSFNRTGSKDLVKIENFARSSDFYVEPDYGSLDNKCVPQVKKFEKTKPTKIFLSEIEESRIATLSLGHRGDQSVDNVVEASELVPKKIEEINDIAKRLVLTKVREVLDDDLPKQSTEMRPKTAETVYNESVKVSTSEVTRPGQGGDVGDNSKKLLLCKVEADVATRPSNVEELLNDLKVRLPPAKRAGKVGSAKHGQYSRKALVNLDEDEVKQEDLRVATKSVKYVDAINKFIEDPENGATEEAIDESPSYGKIDEALVGKIRASRKDNADKHKFIEELLGVKQSEYSASKEDLLKGLQRNVRSAKEVGRKFENLLASDYSRHRSKCQERMINIHCKIGIDEIEPVLAAVNEEIAEKTVRRVSSSRKQRRLSTSRSFEKPTEKFITVHEAANMDEVGVKFYSDISNAKPKPLKLTPSNASYKPKLLKLSRGNDSEHAIKTAPLAIDKIIKPPKKSDTPQSAPKQFQFTGPLKIFASSIWNEAELTLPRSATKMQKAQQPPKKVEVKKEYKKYRYETKMVKTSLGKMTPITFLVQEAGGSP